MREKAWTLTIAAARSASSQQCHDVEAGDRLVRELDAEVHKLFQGQQDVGVCLRLIRELRAPYDRCLAVRASGVPKALAIQNLGERGKALARLPECGAAPKLPTK